MRLPFDGRLKMNYRTLGKTGLKVSEIGSGTGAPLMLSILSARTTTGPARRYMCSLLRAAAI